MVPKHLKCQCVYFLLQITEYYTSQLNTCHSDHEAIARANLSIPGYKVNGTGLALCSRHALVRSNGVGDLVKGEKLVLLCSHSIYHMTYLGHRYPAMDWIVLSCLIGITLLRLVISYDIACQWRKNLFERMTEYPEEMRLPSDLEVEVGIPNWHVNGHGMECQNNLLISYIPGVGRTCGEDVETSWAHTNSLAPSTREMGPGARRETLNDHWNGWNFRKIVGFRKLNLLFGVW